ncbi:hypothetical protein AZE42_13740 [Rhizopogon vesiculosus]|uniref:Uncharacterized protein n=1 Tax=Rhizopogon vesiculosus TaxID=180088 RepID=A0A1J8Q576_9AGAM|nr:hypothetical protein AZE42_13740 [Rhizopogon vesiculosus]
MKTLSHLYDGGVHQKLVQVEPAMMLSQQVLWTQTLGQLQLGGIAIDFAGYLSDESEDNSSDGSDSDEDTNICPLFHHSSAASWISHFAHNVNLTKKDMKMKDARPWR